MTGYGQYCAVARALEILGERWTLLVVRELLLGSDRFNDIHRGLPRMSRTMLSARLRNLQSAGIVTKDGGRYRLSESGIALQPLVASLGGWAMQWDRRGLLPGHLDAELLIVDIRRSVRPERLPERPTVVELTFRDVKSGRFYLHAQRPHVNLCADDAGRDVALRIDADLGDFTRWWLGEITWDQLLAQGSAVPTGPAALRRAFPTWFNGYALNPFHSS